MERLQHFTNFFDISHCRSAATINQCLRLRYQTYCIEHKYLPAENYPGEIETDIYDARSTHVLLKHKSSGRGVATVRLVLCDKNNPAERFPLEHFEILRRMKRDSCWVIPRESIGEISRFAITKAFRRRGPEEQAKIHGITSELFDERHSGRRQMADITIGLFRAVIEASEQHDLTHWYAVMEPALIRLFSRYGIFFNEVGPPIQYYGIRQPCIAVIKDVLRGIYENKKDVWNFITEEGKLYGTNYLKSHQDEVATI